MAFEFKELLVAMVLAEEPGPRRDCGLLTHSSACKTSNNFLFDVDEHAGPKTVGGRHGPRIVCEFSCNTTHGLNTNTAPCQATFGIAYDDDPGGAADLHGPHVACNWSCFQTQCPLISEALDSGPGSRPEQLHRLKEQLHEALRQLESREEQMRGS